MAIPTFTIDADLRKYIREFEKATTANNRFRAETVKVTAAIRETSKGMKELQISVTGLNKRGEELRLTETAQAKTTKGLVAAKKAQVRVLRTLTAEEKRSATAARLNKEAAAQAKKNRETANGFRVSKQLASAENRAANAARRNARAQRSAGVAIRQQSKLAKDLTITWRSFFRLIALRIAAGAIFRLTNLLREGTTEAIEFSRKIAEVQTIIRSSEQSIVAQQRITRRIIDISARNNFELADTTEAFYDSLSNQVSDSLDGITSFTTTAIRLAKASVSSLEDSANSIVSVVQAFNLSFIQAETIAGNLFNLVDRGRLRLNEIANTLGNVAVPAQAVGVSFNELAATLANLTLQGIAVNRSQTLLRNLFLKMIAPTEKLKQLYREWGVESGKQANQTFTLIGVFQKLNIEAEKSSTFIAEIFGRIRAQIAATASLGENIGDIIEALDEIQGGAKRFSKAVELVRESAGENVQKELRQFKIALFELIGLNVLIFLDKFDKEVIDLSDSLAKLAVVGATALAVMAATAITIGLVLAAPTIGLVPILITVAAGIVGIAAGFALISKSGSQAFARLRKESDLFATQLQEKTIIAVADLDRQLRALNVDVFRTARVLAAEERRELFAIQDLSEKILEEEELKLEAEERYLDVLVNSKRIITDSNGERLRTNTLLKANLDVQTDITDEAFRALQISRQRVVELNRSFEASRVERFIRRFNALEQIQLRVQRAGILRRRAVNLFNIGNIDEARTAIDEAVNQLTRADQEFFQGTGITRFEKAFSQLEATALAIERSTQAVQKNLGNTAQGEARALTSEILRNEDALEAQKKLVKDVKDILEEIGRVTDDNTLKEKVKNEIVAAQANLLDLILGRENKISDAIQKQVSAKLRLAQLATDERALETLEEAQTKAITAQSEALQEQRSNFNVFQTEIIRATEGLKLLEQQIKQERTKTFLSPNLTVIESETQIAFINRLLKELNEIINKAEPLTIKAKIENPSDKDIKDIRRGFEPIRKEIKDLIASIPVSLQEGDGIFGIGTSVGDVISEILDDQIEIIKVLDVQDDLDDILIEKKTELRIILDGIKEVETEINALIKEQGTSVEALLDPLNEETNNFKDRVDAIKDESAEAEKRLFAAREAVILSGQNKELIDKVLKGTTEVRKEEVALTKQVIQKTRAQLLFEESVRNTAARQARRRKPREDQGITVDGKFISLNELRKINLEPAIEQIEKVSEAERRAKEQGRLMIEVVRNSATEFQLTGEQEIIFQQQLNNLEQQFFNDEFAIRFLIGALRDLRIELQTLPTSPIALGFAAGGFVPKGTDTIPAMLSPGEFVVNAQATLMNRSLLHLINKSSAPVKTQYLQQGGPVTQNNISTFNMQSVSENFDVKRIGRKLETLQRRGVLGKRRIYG